MAVPESITRKVASGERLTPAEGVALLRDGDLLELGALADCVRERLHPEGGVTSIVDRDLPSKEGYLLSEAQLAQKIEETIALGGSQILLQGGLHPDLGIEFYEE